VKPEGEVSKLYYETNQNISVTSLSESFRPSSGAVTIQ